METTANGWTVIDRDAAVLAIEYAFNDSGGKANAFVARLADGRLVVLSPPCGLSDAAFADLTAFGDVGAVVATNGFHHLGQAEWKARFPDARYFAAPETHARIKKKNAAAGDFEPLSDLQPLLAEGVGVREAPSTKCGETWAWAAVSGGYALFTGDVLHNIPALPDAFIPRMLFKFTGTKPGYGIFHLAAKFILKDKKKSLNAMLADVKAHPPTIVVPGHGPILTQPGLAAETEQILAAAV